MMSSLERTRKKTPVASIAALESVATQRPSYVDVVGPKCARHNINYYYFVYIQCAMSVIGLVTADSAHK
jgi:hypothetical protein